MTSATALQHLIRFGNGSDYKSIEAPEGPYPVYGSGGEFARATEYLHEGESVLFGRKGTVDRPLYVNGRFWTVDTMYYTIPGPQVEPKFLYYWATTIPFGLYSTNTALPSMTSGMLGRLQFPLLERKHQRRIADYLDRETATIDALIEKQRALVGALRERRSAVVEHALEAAADRGLLLKRLVSRVDQGISPDTSSATGLEDIWVLKSGASNDGFFNEEASKPVPESVTVPLEIELHEGDLVVSRASGSPRLVGSAAIVGQLSRRLVLSDKNFRLVPSQNVWVRYLYWALNSQIYREQVLRSISGAEGLANNLPLSKLMNFTVPVPPLEEQREIADHLDRETAKIDALIAKAERFIELAQERRAALITAAVTGQIEIPTED